MRLLSATVSSLLIALLCMDSSSKIVNAWISSSTNTISRQSLSRQCRIQPLKACDNSNNNNNVNPNNLLVETKKTMLGLSLACTLLCSSSVIIPSQPANAYNPNDYASETVTTVLQSLQNTKNVNEIIQVYENIVEIITEGKGVGGEINYKGIQLDRGYVADEDTAIYNPGLTLLTESEKERLVDAIIQTKKKNINIWNVDAQAGYEFLREKLDPLHMYELRGYLQIVPYYGAIIYLGVLAIQQLARDFFPVAYIAGVIAIFGPAIALVLAGP